MVVTPTPYLPPEFLLPLQLHSALPSSHRYVSQSMKLPRHMVYLTYGWQSPTTFTTLIVSWDTSKYATPPSRKCKFGAKFEFSNQVIMIGSPSNRCKLLSPLLRHHDSPTVGMTLLSLVGQLKVIGLQTVSEVCFTAECLIKNSHYLSGHTVIQIRLIFHLLHSNMYLTYVQRFNDTLSPPSCNTTDGAAGLHILRRAMKRDGT